MEAVIEQILWASPNVKRFFLRPISDSPLLFAPGQFITLKLPDNEGGTYERSYSIANAPDESGLLELCIVLKTEGKVTPVLWEMKVQQSLEISEALGTMLLPEIWDKELCFVCTGTGVAPFRSMIGSLLANSIHQHPIHLVFGNRTAQDILYREEFEQWAKTFDNFHFYPVLSQQQWEGRTGYVHATYEQLFADGRDAHFYVCGWKAMCAEARQRLKTLGYNRRQYTFEQYDG